MRREDLYRSIGNLDERLIENSELAVRMNRRIRWGSIAACAALAAVLAAAGTGLLRNGAGGTSGNQLAGGDQNAGAGQLEVFWTEQTQDSQEPESQETLPANDGIIRYSELALAANVLDPEVAEAFGGSGETACLKQFEESMLAGCAGIIEGVVTDIHVRTYTYQMQFDKFGESGLVNQNTKSVVYEIKVDKTWYGEDRTGQTIKIEDAMFWTEGTFAVRKGHRYVIPLEEAGNEIYALPDYVGGDLTRESVYSTLYEFHPQIEVTQDNCYVVSKDWETLYAGDVREIVMDQEFADGGIGAYYKDRMGLLTGDAFAERMELLLANIGS